MRRQDKYPDTPTFHYYNANPRNRHTDDCVVRAIATATCYHYNDIVMWLAELQVKTGYCLLETRTVDEFLSSIGWEKNPQPRKRNGKKYTGKEFCKAFCPTAAIANIGGHHMVAIVNGKVWDTWDSTDGCIGNYWTYTK